MKYDPLLEWDYSNNLESIMQRGQYVVELPDDLDKEGIIEYLEEISDQYLGAFDLDVFIYNERAIFDQFDIEEIDVDEGSIKITYTVHYGVYEGCKDMLFEGFKAGLICIGKRIGNKVTFQEAEPHIPRSTFEEF